MLATAPPSEATTIFKEQWQAYQAVTKGGHLNHEELFTPLRTFLKQQYPRQAIRLVDLGCGQGNALGLLCEPGSPDHVDVSSYTGEWGFKVRSGASIAFIFKFAPAGTGVDLSAAALQVAQQDTIPAMLPAGTQHQLVEQDMISFVSKLEAGQADLILASFAVHHLSLEDKQRLLHEAARALKPSRGLFCVVDAFRHPGQTRSGQHLTQHIFRGSCCSRPHSLPFRVQH